MTFYVFFELLHTFSRTLVISDRKFSDVTAPYLKKATSRSTLIKNRFYTSNVTGRHRSPASDWLQSAVTKSDLLFVVVEYNGHHIFHHRHVAMRFHHRVWYRVLSALCVYSTFGHHPHPRGYLCVKFHFFHGLHY